MFISAISLPGSVPDRWPFTMPAVRQLAADGLIFTSPVTMLVGENGSGKSTLVEAIADTVKINSEGGKLDLVNHWRTYLTDPQIYLRRFLTNR